MEIKYTCHSGGCKGSDIEWENECAKYGIPTISYSFGKHSQYGRNQVILTDEQLQEGWEQVLKCEKPIKRSLYNVKYNPYVKNLLCRNWFQVKNSQEIYAVGRLILGEDRLVDGGTGWAVQMAINNHKPVWLFEQVLNCWMIFYSAKHRFVEVNSIPHLVNNFAGIGTRQILDNGKEAIKNILQYNLK